MALVQITEEEHLRLQGLNNFAQTMLNNPEAAKLLESAAKIVNPNIKTPRLDAAAAQQAPLVKIEESLAALNKRLDEDAAARANDTAVQQANAKREAEIGQLRKKGWNDAGIEAVEKFRTERGIASALDAAILFEQLHPAPTPSMPGSAGAFNFNDSISQAKPDDDIKKLLATRGKTDQGLDAIVNKMTADTLADIRNGQG